MCEICLLMFSTCDSYIFFKKEFTACFVYASAEHYNACSITSVNTDWRHYNPKCRKFNAQPQGVSHSILVFIFQKSKPMRIICTDSHCCILNVDLSNWVHLYQSISNTLKNKKYDMAGNSWEFDWIMNPGMNHLIGMEDPG